MKQKVNNFKLHDRPLILNDWRVQQRKRSLREELWGQGLSAGRMGAKLGSEESTE